VGGNYITFGVRDPACPRHERDDAAWPDPYGGTFLTFSTIRATRCAAALMNCTLFVFTHDSIGFAEDGPTHRRSSTARLRPIPNEMDVWPCELAGVTILIAQRAPRRPACLLSRRICLFST
jgi:transketolase